MGAWRYTSDRRSKLTLIGAMAFSAAVHAIALFGFNHHKVKAKKVVLDDAAVIQLTMPDLKDLEEPEKIADTNEPPVDQGLSVPMLADVPTTVDLSTAFVQQIDYSSLVPQQDMSSAKALTIPTVIRHGGKIGEGMGKIFDIKDLDRVPTPIAQVGPVVPQAVKQDGVPVKVVVGFVVDANGVVMHTEVVSTTDYRMNDAAMTAVSKWKFRPGMKGGRRVNVRMQQPFNIQIDAS